MLEKLPIPIILGMQILRNYQAIIDLRKNQIDFFNEELHAVVPILKDKLQTEYTSCQVSSIQTVKDGF